MNPNRQFAVCVVAGLAFGIANVRAQDHVTRIPTSDGSSATLISGQPAPAHYGPPPAFATLDINQDGFISRDEAKGYMPLFNDFDNLAHNKNRISQRQFEQWVRLEGNDPLR